MRVPSYRGLTFQSIKDSGAVLWHDLMAGHSVEALVDLAGENAELAAGIARFADEVVNCGLMRPTTEAPVPSGPAATAAQAATMTAPALESFGDMQDLLLLDPVHEVDEEMGWPKAQD